MKTKEELNKEIEKKIANLEYLIQRKRNDWFRLEEHHHMLELYGDVIPPKRYKKSIEKVLKYQSLKEKEIEKYSKELLSLKSEYEYEYEFN